MSASDPVLVCLLRHGADDALDDVVDALPTRLLGHPVRVLVVHGDAFDAKALTDDGWLDALDLGPGAGLGALARAALDAGTERGAAVVVLLDPSGEYDAEELALVVRPILHGDADHVVGSRFVAGRPRAMAVHRRIGNRLLTRSVRRHTRLAVTDGQSGFRALSGPAAAAGEVIHDFNHTQVLTLDLVAKGFRYLEVPITYAVRPTGSSWVRPARYVRRVRAGIRRQLRTTSAVTAFGPPLDLSADPSDLISAEPTVGPAATVVDDGQVIDVRDQPGTAAAPLPRPGDRTAPLPTR